MLPLSDQRFDALDRNLGFLEKKPQRSKRLVNHVLQRILLLTFSSQRRLVDGLRDCRFRELTPQADPFPKSLGSSIHCCAPFASFASERCA